MDDVEAATRIIRKCESTQKTCGRAKTNLSSFFSFLCARAAPNVAIFQTGCVWLHVSMYMHMQCVHVTPGMYYMYPHPPSTFTYFLLYYTNMLLTPTSITNTSLFALFCHHWSKLIEHCHHYIIWIAQWAFKPKQSVKRNLLLYKKEEKKFETKGKTHFLWRRSIC